MIAVLRVDRKICRNERSPKKGIDTDPQLTVRYEVFRRNERSPKKGIDTFPKISKWISLLL